MDDQIAELIPLFFEESRGRLGRLVALAPRIEEAAVAVEARRELHTLRGSCQLLELASLADLCREGEELLDRRPPEVRARLEALLGRFDRLLAEAANRWARDPRSLGGV